MGEFYHLRDQLWWELREFVRSETSMLPPNEQLLEELGVPTYAIINGKVRVMKKDTMREELGRSPNYADAVCMTFYKAPEMVDWGMN